MLEISLHNDAPKQVANDSLNLKDSNTDSENLSSLIRLFVTDGQKKDSSNVVSFICILLKIIEGPILSIIAVMHFVYKVFRKPIL